MIADFWATPILKSPNFFILECLMTKFGMVFLMLATLLVSCSDSGKTGSEQSVA